MLYSIISNLKGCQFAHIVTLTEVKKIPKKWGFDGAVVTKRFEGAVQLNYTYENAVNNRLEKQGNERTFESAPLRWGEWEIFNKVITHKGARYLRYYGCNTTNKPNVEYFVNGRPATAEETDRLKAYEATKYKASARQSAEGLNTNQVVVRDVAFENVQYLKVGGQTYIKPIPSSLSMVG